MSGWLARHLQALLFALGRLVRAPWATGFTVMVIAIALTLPAGFALLVESASRVSDQAATAIDLSVYFKLEIALPEVQQRAAQLRARPDVSTVQVITAEQALRQLQQDSGLAAALAALGDNPLPQVISLRPSASASTPAAIDALRRELAAWPQVDAVQVDGDWARRLTAILALLRRLALTVGGLLALGVVAVVGNIIRLEIHSRRAEIDITQLVGGSPAFIRRPFLYTGALYGGLGAVLAMLLLTIGSLLLATPVSQLAVSYGSHFALAAPGWREFAALLAAGVLLGLTGAWIAASRQLAALHPRLES